MGWGMGDVWIAQREHPTTKKAQHSRLGEVNCFKLKATDVGPIAHNQTTTKSPDPDIARHCRENKAKGQHQKVYRKTCTSKFDHVCCNYIPVMAGGCGDTGCASEQLCNRRKLTARQLRICHRSLISKYTRGDGDAGVPKGDGELMMLHRISTEG